MENTTELMAVDNICNRVYFIRGQQVMLDYDLAEIYRYEVRALNQQVKRNINRFPEDFMFQIERHEVPDGFSKSQIVTLNEKGDKRGTNIKKLPYVFTEQGIYMLATVLKGELAEQQSIDAINENFVSDKDFKNFVIYKGQKFEADMAYIDIYQQAERSIYVVDDFVNAKTLQLLSQKKDGVEVVLFTENRHGRKGFLTPEIVNDYIGQYPPLTIKGNEECHDRLIVTDYGLPAEQVYHCGASSKDAGKKLCAINKIENVAMIHPVIDGLMKGKEKVIAEL